jgi:dihydrofolate reductase
MDTRTTVIAIAAVTIDGKIARGPREFTDWTSPEDKELLHSLLDRSDVVVVGNNTYKSAKGPLSRRNCIVFTRSVATMKRIDDNLLLCNPEGAALRTVLGAYGAVAVLGGTQTYTYFVENDLLNELYLTIEPLMFGKGLSVCEGLRGRRVDFRLISIKELNCVFRRCEW